VPLKLSRLKRFYYPVLIALILASLNISLQRVSFITPRSSWDPSQIVALNPDIEELSTLPASEVEAIKAVYQPDFTDAPQIFKILLLANSQSYIIADGKPGDLTIPHWLQLLLASQEGNNHPPIEIRVGALPDLTQSEYLIKLVAAGEQEAGSIDVVVGGISLRRTTQDNAVRPEVVALLQSPKVYDQLQKLAASSTDLPFATTLISSVLASAVSDRLELTSSKSLMSAPGADIVEIEFQSWLGENFSLFSKAPQLRQWLIIKLIQLRNRAFGITSATPRPFTKTAYRTNLELIEMGLRYAQSRGFHVILYLNPVRPLLPNPTPLEDILQFRADIPRLCERYNAIYFDLTDAIPEQYWTVLPADDENGFSGQPDYYHITAEGHKRLAQILFQDQLPFFDQWIMEKVNNAP
jgi:hypothetical protein